MNEEVVEVLLDLLDDLVPVPPEVVSEFALRRRVVPDLRLMPRPECGLDVARQEPDNLDLIGVTDYPGHSPSRSLPPARPANAQR